MGCWTHGLDKFFFLIFITIIIKLSRKKYITHATWIDKKKYTLIYELIFQLSYALIYELIYINIGFYIG